MYRKQEREIVFRTLFSYILNPDSKFNLRSSKYIDETLDGIKKNISNLEIVSSRVIDKWNLEEVGNIEKTLIFLAFYEIIYAKLDYKIVANEAVELAKKYGNEHAPKFINGAIARLIKEKS